MSERAGLWGLRVLAVALALVTWFFASVEKRERISERVIDAAVTYNPVRGTIILDPVQTVKVRLRGSDRKVRGLNPLLVDVILQLPAAAKGPLDFQLGPENVLRPDGLEVVSIDPNVLRLQLDREVSQMIAVRPRLVGEPAAGAVPRQPVVDPPEVLVSGPESRLRGLVGVTTAPISLDGHALDFEELVMVVAPDPLIKVVQPSMVKVQIPMSPPEAGSAKTDRRGGS
jgi:YbbR domain-containing protein